MVNGAFTLGLIFGADSNPDANRLIQITIFLHSTGSYQKTIVNGKKNV
jgi:hypothetical protein